MYVHNHREFGIMAGCRVSIYPTLRARFACHATGVDCLIGRIIIIWRRTKGLFTEYIRDVALGSHKLCSACQYYAEYARLAS